MVSSLAVVGLSTITFVVCVCVCRLERSARLTQFEREQLLNQIDFSRVNEQTIGACKSNRLIPQALIIDAALALCVQLRHQLNETNARLRCFETRPAKSRSTSGRSSSKTATTCSRRTMDLFRCRLSDAIFRHGRTLVDTIAHKLQVQLRSSNKSIDGYELPTRIATGRQRQRRRRR
jgi:hypothetical protein